MKYIQGERGLVKINLKKNKLMEYFYQTNI